VRDQGRDGCGRGDDWRGRGGEDRTRPGRGGTASKLHGVKAEAVELLLPGRSLPMDTAGELGRTKRKTWRD
jgi:hypothetical protein